MRRRDFRALRGPGGGGPSPGLALGLALCAVLQAALAADSAELAAATEVWTPAAESEAVTLDTVRPPGPPGANATLMARMQDSRRDRQERRMSSRGWSTWSDWSTCSRTCDGGASYQLRRCKSAAGCRGDAMRYKICNMQPCVDAVDFRAQQCEAWNREARHGRFYRWTPYHDEARACALVCRGEPVPEGVPGRGRQGGRAAAAARRRRARKKRAKHRGRRDHRKEQDSETGGNGQDEVDPEEADDIEEEEVDVDEHDGDEDDEDHVDVGSGPIVEVLAPKAQDGTRCRPGSLDMCINGRCQHVGCDLRIGSRKTVDGCGVCGGDGSTCATPLYHWDTVPSSLCSEACGGGYRSASHVCKNRVTGLEVEDALCDQTRRPEGEVEPCNTHRCPAKWIAEAWEMCSATCGGGWRHRDVYCAEVISGNLTKVSDDMCFGTAKPRHKEPCGSEKCPTWDSGEWSECSASCGMGIQTRPLTCVDSYGSSLDDTACDPLRQPPLTRTCLAPAPCPAPQQTYNSLVPSGSDEDDADDTFDPDADSESEYTDPLMRPYPPPMPAVAERLVGSSGAGSANDRAFVPGPWGPCSASCGEGAQHREVHCRVYLEGTKARARIDDRECPGPKPAERQSCSGPPCVSTTSRRFVVGEWGPCSSTCGEGVQRREVHCRLFLELSRATTTLKAHQCPDPKPPDSRPCTVALCPMANTLEYRQDPPMADTAESPRVGGRKGTFSWRDQGFGECSKSCLGGVQEAIIQCIREDDDKVVTPHLCSQEPKPEQRTRTCNDQPCPPRWNVTEFSQCSDVCGMGIKSREVVCIHEVTNAIVHRVAPSRCPAPPPPDRSYCNVLDCPAAWNASEWSKCSKHCNGGVKTRVVSCTQRMAQNHVVVRPASQCPAEGRPSERRPCNPKPCSPEDNRPHIDANPDAYNYEAKPNQRQAAVKIGGTATIFLGTRLKIRCPVKRFNRSKIAWHKDGKPLHSSKKYHISNKAVLRVNDATVQDAGRYTCHAGHSSADLTVMVKSRPGEFISSEEIAGGQQTQQHPRHRGPGDSGQGLVFPVAGGGDISHEVSPTGTSRYNMKRKTAPPPEKPYYPSSERNNPVMAERLSTLPPLLSMLDHRPPDAEAAAAPADSPGGDHAATTEESLVGPGVLLGKGSAAAAELRFEWAITPWSDCSETCGGNGFQLRGAQCTVRRAGNATVTESVDAALCEDAGQPAPTTFQRCGGDDCPRWAAGDWSTCEDSRCFAWNTAMQRRDVDCKLPNGTVIDPALCDEAEKPPVRLECYNDRCKGAWRVGEWSECTARCDSPGVKHRILQCVWFGTKKAAGNACREQPRPVVMKACKGPPCAQGGECRDESQYCTTVRSMNLCRLQRYQTQCCQSCRPRG